MAGGGNDVVDLSNFSTLWTADDPPYVILKWSIENFYYVENVIRSPCFDISQTSKWNLLLDPHVVIDGDNFVGIYLKRNTRADPMRFMLKGELSVHGPASELMYDKLFEEIYDPNDSIEFHVSKVFFPVRPDGYDGCDTYMVRCEMVVSREINTVNQCRSYLEKLSCDFKHLYDADRFTDVGIRAVDAIIHSHKAILWARSPFYAARLDEPVIYFCENNENNPYLAAVLLFVYTGNPDLLLSSIPLEMFGRVAIIAKRWELNELVNLLTPLKMHCRTSSRYEKFQYRWEIKNLSVLEDEATDVMHSSEFFMKDGSATRWKLTLEKNLLERERFYGLFLTKVNADNLSHKTNIEFRITNTKSRSTITKRREFMFGPRGSQKCGFSSLFNRSFHQTDLINDDTLEIVCLLKIRMDTESWVEFKATSIDNLDKDPYFLKYLKILSRNIKNLYLEGRYCDIKLHAGTEIVKAHKAVLWARSPYFRKVLKRYSAEYISLPMEVDTLKDTLKYMYSAELPLFTPQNMQKIYVASDFLKLRELWAACRSYMLLHITVDNVLEIMVMAHDQGDTDLEREAEVFASTRGNAKMILNTTRWRSFCSNYNVFAMRIYHNLAWEYCRLL